MTTTKPKAKKAPVRRTDATGHLDPKYAAELRALGTHEKDDNDAFRAMRSADPFAEQLGEAAVKTMTTGEDEAQDSEEVPEETGGPFVITEGKTEFAEGTDASNPRGAKREPFPRT